ASKKQQNHTLNGKKSVAKKQQTKTTKHTIEFSNNRPCYFVTLFWGNPTSLILISPAGQVASIWLVSSGLRQPRQLNTDLAGVSSPSLRLVKSD
ncbi:hypothetical protein ABQF34_06010, partial [Mycolicibacterium boenickei]